MSFKANPSPLSSHKWHGMTIGLLGGTFNPPHEGHVLLSQTALKALSLDYVWWLVTPQNPLKKQSHLAPLAKRMADTKRITAHDPHILPTDIEQRLGTSYTIDTVRALKRKFPHTRFVWICGSDIAAQFSHWRLWQDLLHEISFVCLARPPHPSIVKGNPLRLYLGNRMRTDTNGSLSLKNPPDWLWLLNTRTSAQSSTKLRKNNGLASNPSASRSAGLKNRPKKR